MQRSHGEGLLTVKALAGRTRIDRLRQAGNAKIRVPKTHGDALEAVLINTAGGITGGDTLDWTLAAGPGTRTVVTTQACERVYKSSEGVGVQTSTVRVGTEASLFWLPQETILFDRGRFRRTIDVTLDEGARFVGLETLLLGREAMGETVSTGAFHDRWRIRRGDALIHADDLRLDISPDRDLAGPAALGGNRAVATLVAVLPDDAETLDMAVTRARALIGDGAGGASRIGEASRGKIVIRLAAPSGFALRQRLLPVLALFLDGQTLPKVWHL